MSLFPAFEIIIMFFHNLTIWSDDEFLVVNSTYAGTLYQGIQTVME